MLKIEKREVQFYDENSLDDTRKYLAVNSLEDTHSHYFENRSGRTVASFFDEHVINELCKFSSKNIGLFLDSIKYQIPLDDSLAEIEIICTEEDNLPVRVIGKFLMDYVNWNKPYSIADFAEEMSKIIEADKNPLYSYFEYDDDDNIVADGFGFTSTHLDEDMILSEINDILKGYINDILERTQTSILAKLDENALITFFTFPEPIKAACKQYLIYFGQFLMDLGIEAQTEIKEDTHKTLFRIIPKDVNESLELIRDALTVYLNASQADDLISVQTTERIDISVMQWQANIMHLKSQLLIANSVIQLKDATIEQLKLSNFQYQNSFQVGMAKNDTDKDEDLIKGIISVKKYDGKGFSVNFAEIFRRLKRNFKGFEK